MNSETPVARRLTSWEAAVGPLSGFVCSVLVTLIGRRTGFEYRRESAMAVFFIVAVFVTSYLTGRLKTQPATVVAFAIFVSAAGAAMVHYQ